MASARFPSELKQFIQRGGGRQRHAQLERDAKFFRGRQSVAKAAHLLAVGRRRPIHTSGQWRQRARLPDSVFDEPDRLERNLYDQFAADAIYLDE